MNDKEKALRIARKDFTEVTDKLFKKADKMDAKAVKKLERMFKSEAKLLDEKIGAFYAKYGEENVVEYRELFMKLNEEEREKVFMNSKEFANLYPQHAELANIQDEIYKLNRYEALQHDLLLQQLRINDRETEYIRDHLKMLTNEAARAMLELTESGSSFNVYNPNVIDIIVEDKWIDHFSLTDRIKVNKQKMAKYLENEFKMGVARGDTYNELSKRMQAKLIITSTYYANRIIRTEGTRVMNEGMARQIEREGGYTEYVYRAILDEKTTQVCRGLDGEVFKLEERQAGVNFPPLHSSCRSSFELVIPENMTERIIEEYKRQIKKSE